MYALTEKVVTVRGVSRIMEGDAPIDVAMFETVINSVNPYNVSISSYATDNERYKANIDQCRQDEEAFRTMVQQVQDEMIKNADAAQLPEA